MIKYLKVGLLSVASLRVFGYFHQYSDRSYRSYQLLVVTSLHRKRTCATILQAFQYVWGSVYLFSKIHFPLLNSYLEQLDIVENNNRRIEAKQRKVVPTYHKRHFNKVTLLDRRWPLWRHDITSGCQYQRHCESSLLWGDEGF